MAIGEIIKYPVDYLILILGLSISAWQFFRSSHLPVVQKRILILGALFYLLWGILHHLYRGDFNARVFLEYLLVALVAVGGVFLVLGQI